ncbi:hypothetical protein [Halalkalicoccus tibetensis]|uniref:Uncharacterized protein n=1 Tax=Halalkalicoccus tibetensis TaxID=175632 RepID=A0ABD5V9Z2_9EURY
MIESQERNVRRDGILFLLGIVGLLVIETSIAGLEVLTEDGIFHQFLLGISIGVLISGIIRVANRSIIILAVVLGSALALTAVLDLL